MIAPTAAPGTEIALRVDQTLTQDATGTLVMSELEALGLDRVRTATSVQYVDHNLLQTDSRNAEDHLFLQSACRRYGLWYSKPGNGVSHVVHMQRFGVPGTMLIGSDSHTCAAGSLGMLAIGVGGLDVAMAMAGEPLYLRMPEIWGIELTGTLPPWVSAKDVILELLRRHGVKSGVNRILEYHGPGLPDLSAMDRHVIANMGAELGATASVFPADSAVRDYLRTEQRAGDYVELVAEPGTAYDVTETIDLAELEPLIAAPSSPGSVTPVREVAGDEVELVKGPNISSLPELDALPDELDVRIELKLGDDISTDEILPAGARVLPLRSNIPAIAQFVFHQVDASYASRVANNNRPHAVIAGENYGQGSSREHAAVAPRQLGLRVVVAKSFARIHWQNLANFGIVALEFADPADYDRLDTGAELHFAGLHELAVDTPVRATASDGTSFELRHRLSERQIEMVRAGGQIALWARSHTG